MRAAFKQRSKRLRVPCAGREQVCPWSARACDLRAVVAAKRPLNRIIAQRFSDNDAVESTFGCRS
eukprot:6950981-Lingulodinium_polyedra.AAC.1